MMPVQYAGYKQFAATSRVSCRRDASFRSVCFRKTLFGERACSPVGFQREDYPPHIRGRVWSRRVGPGRKALQEGLSQLANSRERGFAGASRNEASELNARFRSVTG